jgi:hypothetical protein
MSQARPETSSFLISQYHRWPTTESRLYLPNQWVGLAGVALFAVSGWTMILIALPKFIEALHKAGSLGQLWQQEKGWFVGGAVALGFALIGSLLVVAWFATVIGNRPFRHAAAGVLPDVPSNPLNIPGAWSHGRVTHEWMPTAHGGILVPRRGVTRVASVFIAVWCALTYAVCVTLVWVFVPAATMSNIVKILICLFVLFPALTLAILPIWLIKWSYNKLPEVQLGGLHRPFEVDNLHKTVQLSGSDGGRIIPLDQVAALQLCALRQKIGFRQSGSQTDSVELNLVLWSDVATNGGKRAYERQNLLIMGFFGQPSRLTELAVTLADALGVPLLNHATREHWDVERRAARARPPQSGGSCNV